MGEDAWRRLMRFEGMLRERYDLNREMKFPFGNHYGWGFRYAHKKSLLLYVFFEEGGFCCTISINDKGARKIEAMLGDLLPVIQTSRNNRYACGVKEAGSTARLTRMKNCRILFGWQVLK